VPARKARTLIGPARPAMKLSGRVGGAAEDPVPTRMPALPIFTRGHGVLASVAPALPRVNTFVPTRPGGCAVRASVGWAPRAHANAGSAHIYAWARGPRRPRPRPRCAVFTPSLCCKLRLPPHRNPRAHECAPCITSYSPAKFLHSRQLQCYKDISSLTHINKYTSYHLHSCSSAVQPVRPTFNSTHALTKTSYSWQKRHDCII
jgi:hypothetical protein